MMFVGIYVTYLGTSYVGMLTYVSYLRLSLSELSEIPIEGQFLYKWAKETIPLGTSLTRLLLFMMTRQQMVMILKGRAM